MIKLPPFKTMRSILYTLAVCFCLAFFSSSGCATAEMSEPLQIRQPPIAFQQFFIPLTAQSSPGPKSPLFIFVAESASGLARWAEATRPLATQTYVCNLPTIKKVRVTLTPFSVPFCCVVLGKNPSPRFGDAANIHLFQPTNIQSFSFTNTSGGTDAFPFTSVPVEMEISSDYRYFTPYFYDVFTTTGVRPPANNSLKTDHTLATILFTGN